MAGSKTFKAIKIQLRTYPGADIADTGAQRHNPHHVVITLVHLQCTCVTALRTLSSELTTFDSDRRIRK